MQVALVPWDERIKQNNIYTPKDKIHVDSHVLLKRAFLEHGDDINTIDMYDNLSDIDFFLFYKIDVKLLKKLKALGLSNRCIYCNGEPPVVKAINSEKGYQKLKHIFPYIMTWNDDLVDNVRIFKRNIPYHFIKQFGKVEFSKRKLLINISGNKHSRHPQELYSEREKVVTFFEKNYPDEITLYGIDWSKKKHLSYQGIIGNKTEVYHHHKFALSLENMRDVKGYVTEKLLDCFVAGIVPIYMGASNIKEFIPAECYIVYEQFKSLSDLANYLKSISEYDYQSYINAISRYLDTGIKDVFSSELYYSQIKVITKNKSMASFSITPYGMLLLWTWQITSSLNNSYEFIRRLLGKARRRLVKI